MNWQAVYRNFDDEALAALGSGGLLRRAVKDVEAGKVAWDEPPGETGGAVRADGQRVAVDGRGPAFARCDCPAPEVCKHILAAALWLRAAPAAGQDDAPPAAAAERADEAPDVLAEVLALDTDALYKAAGRAAVRKAAGLLPQAGDAELTVQGAALLVRLPGLGLDARYIAGAGFAGMLSEAAASSRAALHLLAIAAVRRAHGRSLPWPGDAADAAAAAAPAAGLSPDERRLLAQARALVVELSESGWSHVSDMAAPQLRALATSARVESLPQLAGLLRSLAGTAELLARRDYGADEVQALRLAARIAALAHALDHASPSAPALARLRGARQRSFGEGATLSLLPLGAHWWEQRGGARGLSAAFWDLDGGRIVHAVSARRDGADPGFSRAGAWELTPLWPGAASPSGLGGTVLRLDAPRLSDDGRLALGGATRAHAEGPLSRDDVRWRAAGYRDWTMLGEAVRGGAGLLGEPIDTVLLRPAAWDAPRLDEIRQQLCWTLLDEGGARLLLRLPYEPWKAERLANLETWAASGQPIEAVLARLDRSGGASLLEPFALAVAHGGTVRAVSLDFERGPARPTLAARLGRLFGGRSAPAPREPQPVHLKALAALLDLLERKGMTGHLQHRDGAAALAELRRILLAVGLDDIAAAIQRYLDAPGAAAALALFHLAQTAADLDTAFLQG